MNSLRALKIMSSTLVVVIVSATVAIAQSPPIPQPETSTQGASSLEDISSPSGEQYPLQTGGSANDDEAPSPETADFELNRQEDDLVDSREQFRKDSQDWQNSNVGEPRNGNSGIPLLDF